MARGDIEPISTSIFPHARWRALIDSMPIWLTVVQAFFVGSWRRHSFNALTHVHQNLVRRRIQPVLVGASDDELAALIDYAKLNQERQQYFSRMLLLAYFTVPFTVLAIIAQLSPGTITGWMNAPRSEASGYAGVIGGTIGGIFAAVGLVLINESRARLLVILLEIVAIERRYRASFSEDDPQTPP